MQPHPQVAKLIKANDRLTAHERLELYARQYWWRLLQSLEGDFPQLRRILGKTRFRRVIERYLVRYPSTSFTLRNAGSKLPKYLAHAHQMLGSKTQLAVDVARVEWALIECFDAADSEPLKPEQIYGGIPTLSLTLRPSVRLLALRYPLEKLFNERSNREVRADASNVLSLQDGPRMTSTARSVRIPVKPSYLVVHRHGESVYIKTITRAEFLVLQGFARGGTLLSVLKSTAKALKALSAQEIQELFSRIVVLELLCARAKKGQTSDRVHDPHSGR